MVDFSSLGGGIADAVGGIFGGIGSFQEAKGYKLSAQAYRQAAAIAEQNKTLSAESEQIQELAAKRQIAQSIGATTAAVAGAGFEATGTGDIIRQSMQQGALQKQIIGIQGQINQNAYQAEADAALGQAGAADAAASAKKSSGIGGILGGVLKGAATIFSIFSDARLKNNIYLVGHREDGIGIYEFNYNGGPQRYRGLIAQDVANVRPDAVIRDEETGYMKVNYALLGAELLQVGHA